MLVKKGDPETAKKIYQIATKQSGFKTWPYKDVLIRRIANAEKNVNQFRQKIKKSDNIKGEFHHDKYSFFLHGLP